MAPSISACRVPVPGAASSGVPGWLVGVPDPAAVETLPGREGAHVLVADTQRLEQGEGKLLQRARDCTF